MSEDELNLRLRQQALVADFGLFALEPGPLSRLVDECCRVAADGLGTTFAKVLRYRTEEHDFLVEAGVGWHAGVVGNATLGAGLDSPAGYALHTREPVLSNLLVQEQRFRVPALLVEHGVQSALNVVIGDGDPYGVLEVDSTLRHGFIQPDTAFIQGLANALSAGINRVSAEMARDQLLHEKDLLMREVHHRVKNSLQLVRTMLALQSRGASDETREQLDAAAGRIMSIAAVHRRLYESGSVTESDAAIYLAGLLEDMDGVIGQGVGARTVELECPPLMLSADALTPLGLIVSELVTNAVKYGAGCVTVRVIRTGPGLQVTVDDEGPGFPPETDRAGGLGMRLIAALAKGAAGPAINVDRTVGHGRVVVNISLG